jgi:hypothetical protein
MNSKLHSSMNGIQSLLLFNVLSLSSILKLASDKRLKLEIRKIGEFFLLRFYKFLFRFYISVEKIFKTSLLSKRNSTFSCVGNFQ